MARLGHILSGGKHVAKVLMLYPMNSIWTNYVPQARNEIGNATEFDFNYLTDILLKLHYDYDYVDEDVLIEAKIEKGKIKIAEEEFSVLILPPVTHIKEATFNAIKKFVESGGKVIADAIIPIELLEYDKKDSAKKIEKLFGKDPEKMLHNFSNGAKFKVHHKNSKGDVFVIEGKGLHQEKKKEELKKILNKCITPDVTISEENIFYLHRVKDDFDIYFLVNNDQKVKENVEITFEKIGKPEIWNATSGGIEPINIYQIKNGRLSIKLDFPETESHIVIIRKDLEEKYISESSLNIFEINLGSIEGYSKNDDAAPFIKINNNGKSKTLKRKSQKIFKTY
jgi:hypothetical protein